MARVLQQTPPQRKWLKPGTVSIDDVFSDVKNLEIPPDFESRVGLDAVRTHVPLQKPAPVWFFRSSATLRLTTALLPIKKLGDDDGIYFVAPSVQAAMGTEAAFLSINCAANLAGRSGDKLHALNSALATRAVRLRYFHRAVRFSFGLQP